MTLFERSSVRINSNFLVSMLGDCFLWSDRWRWSLKRRRTRSPSPDSSVRPLRSVEGELRMLQMTITRLLAKLNDQSEERSSSFDQECVVCVVRRACMQSFPCGHKVLCRKCFIRTIQLAVNERRLPVRCVVCRADIIRLKTHTSRPITVRMQTTPPTVVSPFPRSVSSCRQCSPARNQIIRPSA